MSDIIFKELKTDSKDFLIVNEIYETEFPEEERPDDLSQFIATEENPQCIFSIWDKEDLIGFIVKFTGDVWEYLLFLAIKRECQGKGYGQKVMKSILDNCGDRILFLSLETPDDKAQNAIQRRRRKDFYFRVGMFETGIKKTVEGVDLEFMASAENVSDEVYDSILEFIDTLPMP